MEIKLKETVFVFMVNSYPGGPLLNPLGLAKDVKNAHEWKLKEIKNGLLCLFLPSLLCVCVCFHFVLKPGVQCRKTGDDSHARHLCASLCDTCRSN